LKSFLAVLAGLILVLVVTTLVDVVMFFLPVFPLPQNMTAIHWLIAVGYRFAIGIFGCWLAARLAPSRPMVHALALGAIGLALAIAGAAIMWNRGENAGPHWYAVTVAAIALPCAWIGGKLHSR
jgi:hypothetical protein